MKRVYKGEIGSSPALVEDVVFVLASSFRGAFLQLELLAKHTDAYSDKARLISLVEVGDITE